MAETLGSQALPGGYSGTPLARKLGIADGHLVTLVNAAVNFEGMIEGLPPTIKPPRKRSPAGADVAVAFFTERA